MKTSILQNFLTISFFLFFLEGFTQNNNKFKIVIDPGHGGELPGARYNGVNEKDLVLKIGLELGELLSKHSDIEVIYTRKKDVNIGLYERTQIANKAKANMFLSIHCNAAENKSARGTETFLLGHSKESANLAVVKKENAVILQEENYELKYKGYNPNSPESFIGINLLQEEYINQSVVLSSIIQKQYNKNTGLKDRGVKQGPFLVLNQVSMPSVLTEIGFISNKEECDYLISNSGHNDVVKSLYDAILLYKNAYFGQSDNIEVELPTVENSKNQQRDIVEQNKVENVSKKDSELSQSKPIYKIQLSADKKLISLRPNNFKGLRNVNYFSENGYYKYTYQQTDDMNVAKNYLAEVKKTGFKDAFIIIFLDGKKITLEQAQNIIK
jgi:N-acetylmuramoyl-L-alanine amidase